MALSLLMAQCIILGVELCFCPLYGLSLASTLCTHAYVSGAAGEEEAVFGYFVPADQGGGQE